MPRFGSEADEMMTYMQWRDYHPGLRGDIWHVPNGGYRNKKEALSLKKQGVMGGVSDIQVAIAVHPWHGLFIEMKRPDKTNTLTFAQITFLAQRYYRDYAVSVCYDATEAIAVTTLYLQGEWDFHCITNENLKNAIAALARSATDACAGARHPYPEGR